MTNKADDVFGDDDPFESLEERLSDVLEGGQQPAPDVSDEPDVQNDAELRLVMERIKSRSHARGPNTEGPAREPEPPARAGAEAAALAVEFAAHDAQPEVVSRPSRAVPTSGKDDRAADPAEDDLEDLPLEWGVGADPESPEPIGDSGELIDLPEFLGADAELDIVGETDAPSIWNEYLTSETDVAPDGPRPSRAASAPAPTPGIDDQKELTSSATAIDSPQNSTFGSFVIASTNALDTSNLDRSFRPPPWLASDDKPAPRPSDEARTLDGPDDAPGDPSVRAPRSPAGLPPSGVTAVQPLVAVGHTPGEQRTDSRQGNPQVISLQAPTQSRESKDRRVRDADRANNSRGLLFIAGGITLIVVSVLVFANYFLRDSSPPKANMNPAADEAVPSGGDASETTFTAAASPTVELTGCDSEAAHVTVSSQSPTPLVAIIRFQFFKDGEIYYEEDSETPSILAGEPLTKSLLLVGKDLPADYVGVEPDDCKAEVIGVAEA